MTGMKKTQNKKKSNSETKTTGHEWDGIQEYDNPIPRWLNIVLAICWVVAVIMWYLYPSWPTLSEDNERGGVKGSLNWTQYNQLEDSLEEIKSIRKTKMDKFRKSSFKEVLANDELYQFAVIGGKIAFKENCSTCHGLGGAGTISGYPNLNDDDWLWGGSHQDIYKTLLYGIRSGHEKTRDSEMNSFKGTMTDQEIKDVADYVYYLSRPNEKSVSSTAGKKLYEQHCVSCHGNDAKGDRSNGIPDLTDAIWLHSKEGTKYDIIKQMYNPMNGVMPAWENRLDNDTIRQLTIYVHSLGGGE